MDRDRQQGNVTDVYIDIGKGIKKGHLARNVRQKIEDCPGEPRGLPGEPAAIVCSLIRRCRCPGSLSPTYFLLRAALQVGCLLLCEADQARGRDWGTNACVANGACNAEFFKAKKRGWPWGGNAACRHALFCRLYPFLAFFWSHRSSTVGIGASSAPRRSGCNLNVGNKPERDICLLFARGMVGICKQSVHVWL